MENFMFNIAVLMLIISNVYSIYVLKKSDRLMKELLKEMEEI